MSIQTIKNGDLEYQVAEGITVPHCFTTRYGGVSTGSQASLNLAIGRGDSEENVEANLRILAEELQFVDGSRTVEEIVEEENKKNEGAGKQSWFVDEARREVVNDMMEQIRNAKRDGVGEDVIRLAQDVCDYEERTVEQMRSYLR